MGFPQATHRITLGPALGGGVLSARRRAISGVMGWRDRDSSEGRFFLATFLLVGRHDRTRLYTRRRTARTEDSGRGRINHVTLARIVPGRAS